MASVSGCQWGVARHAAGPEDNYAKHILASITHKDRSSHLGITVETVAELAGVAPPTVSGCCIPVAWPLTVQLHRTPATRIHCIAEGCG